MVITLKCIVNMLAIKTRVVEGLQDNTTTKRIAIVKCTDQRSFSSSSTFLT